jgi:type IV pilus assembly protein PilV
MNKLLTNEIRRVHTNDGFTLLEVLVAAILLTIGMLGTLGLTTGVVRGNALSKNITSATAIAQSQIEAAQREGYANATTTKFPTAAATVSMGGKTFSRLTVITTADPDANTKTVAVTVSWPEANGTTPTVTLKTILAQ